jgi:hypothetical protein
MITVTEQSTSERLSETKQLFESIKPLLDNGCTYRQALKEIGRITPKSNPNIRHGWFRHLIDYGTSQGYPYIYAKLGRKVKQ